MARHRLGEPASADTVPSRLSLVDNEGVGFSVEAIAAGGIPVRAGFDDNGERLVEALLIQSRRRRDGGEYEEDQIRDLQIAKGHRERVWWLLGVPERSPWTVRREIRQELGVRVAVGGLLAVYHRVSNKYDNRDVLVGKEFKEVRIHEVTLIDGEPLSDTDERKEWAAIGGRGAEVTHARMRYPEELHVVRMVAAAHMAVDEAMREAA